jgi:leucine dehydrogenase
MEKLLKEWKGESVILSYDQSTSVWIIIAVHSTKLGPATGGTRMKSYRNLAEAIEDAQRLAEGMTLKWAAAGVDMGGGKAVLHLPYDLDHESRTGLLRRYGSLVQRHRGLFLTGPDMGTSPADMDIIGLEAPDYVFGRTVAAGGAGNPAPFTALGVFVAIEATAECCFKEPSLAGKKVLVQGTGSVGSELIELLVSAGSEVLFSDINERIIQHYHAKRGLRFVPSDQVYGAECDIFSPCAIGGILNEETIPLLRCRAVVGGANNQLATPQDGQRLSSRDILYAPDFVANCGGAVAITLMETKGWSREKVSERVRQAVGDNLTTIFRWSTNQAITTDEAARRLANERLSV